MENIFKLKKPIIVVLALLILGGGVWAVSSKKEQPAEVQGVQEEVFTADLVLDFSEEKVATYSGVRIAEKTVLGLLLRASQDKGFKVSYDPPSGEMGAFVKSIDGVENTSESFWQFWLNGEYGQVAMDQQEIKGGDLVEIKFRGFE